MTKILKQNGVGGKIIRAQGVGKVLKQNYNFGNCLNFYNPYKITIPGIVGLSFDDITIVRWYYNPTSNSNFHTDLLALNCDAGQFQLRSYNSNDSRFEKDGVDVVSRISISHMKTKLYEVCRSWSDAYANGSWSIRGNNYSFQNIQGLKMYSGITTTYLYNIRQSYFALYSRRISDNEVVYGYNNLLGNEPLNRNGLLFEYDFSFAEILDFSEAQDESDLRVGIRNKGVVINGHAEITGLPAGTLEEQTDFVNSNLIKLW
nr:hypothetical protein [uncultured Carboxylicivirga sp.]